MAPVQPFAGVKLKLTVVDDKPLAEAAGLLRGEWTSQTGAEFEVIDASADILGGGDPAKVGELGDAIICQPRELGPLASAGMVAPLPNAEKLRQGDWAEIFELLTLREAVWNKQPYGVPFGSPVLVCYYRADLLRKLGRKPPQTWADYQTLSALLAERKNLGDAAPAADAPWCGTIEPLGGPWAATTFLARAAAYVKHRSNLSTLFDIRTMEPLIDGPPFVRALDELAAAAKLGPKEPLAQTPEMARAAFWRGECGMALSWPTASKAVEQIQPPEGASIEVGFARLPGSAQAFDISSRAWGARNADEDPHVPLLGATGRMGFVSAKANSVQAAAQLLLWLADKTNSPQVSPVSSQTTLFRDSQMKSPQKWVEPAVPPLTAARYASLTQQSLDGQTCLLIPRMPGMDEYLHSLEAAIGRTVRGEQTSLDSLHDAALEWGKITERRGLEGQKKAYLRCLGLD